MTTLTFVIANEPHGPVPMVRTDLRNGFDGVVDRALAKEGVERSRGGTEMATALRPEFGMAA